MKHVFPTSDSEAEWAAARSRLDDYLRALHLPDQEERDRIIRWVLERAARQQAKNPGPCLPTVVMDELCASLERWFQQRLASQEPARVARRGFLAWFALGTPEPWAAALLAENPPADLQRRLQACQIYATPPLRVSSMVPQTFAHPPRPAADLPAPWGKLARTLAPLAAKATTAALSALSLLSSVRLW